MIDAITYALLKGDIGQGTQEAVTEYLDEHLTNPSNPPIDTSLEISGAAADSKTTGDKINELKEELTLLSNTRAISTNIAPVEPATTGAIQADGSISTSGVWGDQRCTPFFPVKPNTKYTVSDYDVTAQVHTLKRKNYLFFDDSKTPITGSYSTFSAYNATVTSPANAAYMRVSVQYNANCYALPNVNEGETEKEYSPYEEATYFGDNIFLSDTMIAEVKRIIGTVNTKTMTVKINGIDILTESETDKGTFKRIYQKNRSDQNRNFNFGTAYINDVAIKGSSDDITPLRIYVLRGDSGGSTMWTVGANHGWGAYRISKGSLTVADSGSVWTDGTNNYTLMYVDNQYAYFAYPTSKEGHTQKFTLTNPVASLTHVQGATHTDTLSISGGIQTQLYPSVKDVSTKLYSNGVELTEGGIYTVAYVDAVEHYDIVGYHEAVTYMQGHVGVDYQQALDNIPSILSINNVYHITPDTEVVYTSVRAIEETTLANCGFLQANSLSPVGGTVYRYVNGVKDGTVFASTGLVDMTNYNTNVSITKSDLIDESKPSNRAVEICVDTGGNILYGFTLGFVPDIGYGADAKRSQLNFLWDMRNSKKIYPHCVDGKALTVNESADVVGYRHYILGDARITNNTIIPVGNARYAFVDAHDTFGDTVKDDDIGACVTELDNNGVVHSDFVGANGVTVFSNAQYSSATLKLT